MLAVNFHWTRAEVLALDHTERGRWVAELERLRSRESLRAVP